MGLKQGFIDICAYKVASGKRNEETEEYEITHMVTKFDIWRIWGINVNFASMVIANRIFERNIELVRVVALVWQL